MVLLTCSCGDQKYKTIDKLFSVEDVLLITGKEDVSIENANKENVSKDDTSKEDIGKEDVSIESTNKENANNPYVPTTTSKTVVCVLLLLVVTAVAYIPAQAIRARKRRIK